MLARVLSATIWGIDARTVLVVADVQNGLPQTHIVGLPDASVRESRERVRSAIRNCGFELKPKAVVVNLAPADLRKEGNNLDLAIALAILSAYGELDPELLQNRIFCGELGLDGSVRPIRGALAVADLGARRQALEILVPASNACEAASLESVPVRGIGHLTEALTHLRGVCQIPPAQPPPRPTSHPLSGPDLSEVKGQEGARRALEIAAAGGHNLLLLGPPGSGKTMLARRLPGVLPPLTLAEAIAATKIQSLSSERPLEGLLVQRPFRSPHTGISTAGLVGGGSVPRPGEVSLAHTGVLFLDELPEFRRDALESLRQPLEDGEVSVVRARARFRFPARFTLLAAMNPCPCGHLGDPRQDCRCPAPLVERYRQRVSGPLLDRIDLHVEVPAIALSDLRGGPSEPSVRVAERVAAARELQLRRFGKDTSLPVNASLEADGVRRYCAPDPDGQRLLDAAFDKLKLSARAVVRILKVARTIADLGGHRTVTAAHVAEAIQYRTLDRRLRP